MSTNAISPKNLKDGGAQRPVVAAGGSSDFKLPHNVKVQSVKTRKSKKIAPLNKSAVITSSEEASDIDAESPGYKLSPFHVLVGTFINFILVLVCLSLTGTDSSTNIISKHSENTSKAFNYSFRCPQNTSLQSINIDGTFLCTRSDEYHTAPSLGNNYRTSMTTNVSYSSCPNNTYMKGLFSNNTVSCERLPSAEKGDKGDKGDQGKNVSTKQHS